MQVKESGNITFESLIWLLPSLKSVYFPQSSRLLQNSFQIVIRLFLLLKIMRHAANVVHAMHFVVCFLVLGSLGKLFSPSPGSQE